MKYIILIILMVALVAVFLWLKGNRRTTDCGQNNDPVEPLNVEPDGKPEEKPVKEEKPVEEVKQAPTKAKKAVDKHAPRTDAKPANVKKQKPETKATAKPKKAPKK